ncbi:MAG: M48 family metallopeptidase [Clostridium sp.]|nr:M48 family metallopeptidase [Clostridium sp.]
MTDYMDIEDLHIPVELRRSNRRTLSVLVTDKGELFIKAPLAMSEDRIERFLNQKRFWIYKQVKHQMDNAEKRVDRSEAEIRRLKEQARTMLTARTDYYAGILQVKYQKIRIGNQRTRWGSCSSRGTVSYNWHLILMPETILDYVVVHELCHLIEMNHSPQFWSRVEKVLPDYRERRMWLKKHGDEYL